MKLTIIGQILINFKLSVNLSVIIYYCRWLSIDGSYEACCKNNNTNVTLRMTNVKSTCITVLIRTSALNLGFMFLV